MRRIQNPVNYLRCRKPLAENQNLAIFAKSSMLDIRQDHEYTFELNLSQMKCSTLLLSLTTEMPAALTIIFINEYYQ